MKAKELRIGNYVKIDESIIKVEYDNIRLQQFSDVKMTNSSGNPFRGYEPISLTEELLLKAGFERLPDFEQDFNAGIAYGYQYGKDYFDLIYVLKTDKGFYFADDYDSHIEEYFNCEIKGLHHLQNIVFDLTGKELEIKL